MTEPLANQYDPLASVDGASSLCTGTDWRIRMASPVTGEEEVDAVRQVLASGILTNGPWNRRFEAAMAERHGTEHGVSFANGTVALSAMYRASGIGPGDEVIVPSLTFVSTATSVLHVGAIPVFADVLPDTLNLDPDDVARRITSRTKAIVPIHYGGQAADLDRFVDLADDAGVILLEDAAQAHGATFHGRPVGSWGRAAMFSFTPTKNITTGEGSVVTTDDGDLARRLRLLRNHGMAQQYLHETLGWNWRLSEMQAAIGCVQLGRLDGILAAKRANAQIMERLLDDVPELSVPAHPADRDHPYMLFSVQVPADRRLAIAAALTDAGIEHRRYFPPTHRQPIFADRAPVHLPVTDAAYDRIVSVPFHSRLNGEEIALIAATLREGLLDPSVSRS